MNTAKLYIDGDGFLVETNLGNYEVKTTGVYPTTRTGNELTEALWDSTFGGVLDNAIDAMNALASVDTAKGLKLLLIEKSEDFD